MGQTSGWTESLGDNAEGATIAATLLNFEVGACLRAWRELQIFEEGVGEAVIGPDGSRMRRGPGKER